MKKTFSAPMAAVALLVMALMISSCGHRDPLRIDTDKITVNPGFYYFEDTLAAIPDAALFETLPKIFPAYAPLFPGVTCDSLFITDMLQYRHEPGFAELHARRQQLRDPLQLQEAAITQVLKHYRYYYPEEKNHRIFFRYSGVDPMFLETPVLVNDTLSVVNLDLFFGGDFPPYKLVGFPEYKVKWMFPEMMPVEYARQLALLHLGGDGEGDDLLGQMVFFGKMLYFIDAMMPTTPDSLKIRFTEAQLDWCMEHQKHVWAYIVSNRMLYASDQNHSKLLIKDAPFTPAFSEASPGRIGWWFGWQIVRKYMRKHPDKSIKDLMDERDARKILQESGYKPG
ncbi:MAG TPA: hypothetical protein P5228_06215 [Bacteroidales bacterium]|nr:hypothetical protein [Bacteroidales bacterium]HRZ48268.1 hypothetical protein [Bacteroidales bacterium]